MALITQAEYARLRGVTRQTVQLRTMTRGGPIPVHGPRRMIDPNEANALWDATMSAAGAANAREAMMDRKADTPPPAMTGNQIAQARAASLVVDVQTKRLALEQRRGALISRDRAVLKVFSYGRTIRDACQTWPARIGPALAATFDLDAAAVTVYLEDQVRTLLHDLASERVDFDA